MLDFFSWQHIAIMVVVALVVVGPKDLPRLMNMAGKWAGKARTMAGEFRRSFDEMARETELAELRKEIENLKKNNPITDIANSVTEAGLEAEAAVADIEPRSGEFAVTDAPATPAGEAPPPEARSAV